MNYLDVFFVTAISVITIRGLFRGLITELMVLVALIMGFVTATLYYPYLQESLVNTFETLPPAVAKVIAFAGLFVAVNIFFRVLAMVLNKIATFTFLQPVNKMAGSAFAFIKTTLFISILIIIIEFTPGGTHVMDMAGKQESTFYKPIKAFAPLFYNTLFSGGSEDRFKEIMPRIDTISTP